MSTKIFNAYKFTGSLHELLKELKKIREKYKLYATDKIKKHEHENLDVLSQGHLGSFLIKENRRRSSSEELTGNTLFKNLNDFTKVQFIKAVCETQTYATYSLAASAVVYTHSFSGKIKPHDLLLVHFFGLPHDFNNKIEGKKFIDFHYQNQTDPYWSYNDKNPKPTKEEIKSLEEDWKLRKKVWDKVLGNDFIFGDAGLNFDFLLKVLFKI